MKPSTTRTILMAAAVTALALALGACHGSSRTDSHPAESALATSTAVQQVTEDFQHCMPANALAQIALAHKLLTDTKKHPNGAWASWLDCMGISAKDKPEVENALLTAAEQGHLYTADGRRHYFTVTVPGIVAHYTAKAASASPSASAKP